MKKSFDIGEIKRTEAFGSVLLLEIGKTSFTYAVLNNDTGLINKYCRYEGIEHDEDFLSHLINGVPDLSYTYRKAAVSYFNNESVQVPDDIYRYDREKTYLENIVATTGDTVIKSEHINGHDLYNIYHVPVAVNNLVSKNYIGAAYWHYFSVILKSGADNEGDLLFTDIRPGEFALMYLKSGKLQFSMIYTYSSPEDVLYHLLKVCTLYNIERETIRLVVSGFVEKQSALYKELYKYFSQIGFDDLPANTGLSDGFDELPAYYFSSLCKLSVCV